MPIYEYRCPKGHEYERAEGFDAPTEQTCPSCGTRARRVISLPAVIFKGSGFYSTDNRKGYASGGNGSSSSSSDGDKSEPASSGSESKSSSEPKSSGSETKAEAAATE